MKLALFAIQDISVRVEIVTKHSANQGTIVLKELPEPLNSPVLLAHISRCMESQVQLAARIASLALTVPKALPIQFCVFQETFVLSPR